MISTCNNGYGSISHVTNLIMLIEDDVNHAELVIRTTREHPIPIQICHFSEGQSALDYLFRRNNFSDPISSPHPQVILLDMHLRGVDGIEILRTIKAAEELKMIPVVMLATSSSERDIARAYYNHANSYLVKPVGCEEFKELMDTVCFYWLGSNMRPRI
jgi:CheY-like chemotaxis protein